MLHDLPAAASKPFLPTLFISYSSMDRAFARQLAEDLSALNVDVWIDERQVDVGDPVNAVLAAAVRQADFVLVVFSKHAARSTWVERELNAALERELRDALTIILPVRIDDQELPPAISDRVFADFRADYGAALNSLANAIKNRRNNLEPKAHSPIRRGGLGVIDPEVIPYFVARLRDERLPIRLAAISVLRTGVPRTAAGLTLALDDSERAVRLAAVGALAECGPFGFDGLLKASYDNELEVRRKAFCALGGTGPRAISRCAEVLDSSEDETVKLAVVSSLRTIGRDSVCALISAIRNTAHREYNRYQVYHAAAEALGVFARESDEALAALVEEVQRPAGLSHVFAAITALGGLGHRAENAIPALIDLAKDTEVDVRMASKEALIQIVGDERYGRSDWSA